MSITNFCKGINCTAADVMPYINKRDDIIIDGWDEQDSWYEYQIK